MQYFIEPVIALFLVIIQVLASRFLSVGGAMPDLSIIFLAFLIVMRGQLVAELSGFFIGLALDILSGGTLGAHAIALVVAGFLLGYFYDEDLAKQRLRNWPFLLFVFAASVITNLVYYFFFTAGSGLRFTDFATAHGGLATLYTVVAAIVPMWWWSRRPLY